MGEGCKWHKGRLAAKMWMVPRFQLGVTNADPPSPNIDGMEFAPMHDGSTWSLQPRGGGNPGYFSGRSATVTNYTAEKTVEEQEQIGREAAQVEADIIQATAEFLSGGDSVGSLG